MFTRRSDVLSWGRIARKPQLVATPRTAAELAQAFEQAPNGSVVPVGARRSYGDTVFNTAGGVIELGELDHLIEIDAGRRLIRAEAGTLLCDLLRASVPHGLFVPVAPGTSHVTLGGAIANDVHGKNHHRSGTFGRHVTRLRLLRTDGAVECGPDLNEALFAATVGGLGLTGIIEWAEIALKPIASSEIDCEVIAFDTLDEFWELSAVSEATHEHTVAWIDCVARGRAFGRGLFSRGNWCRSGETFCPQRGGRTFTVPIEPPGFVLNRHTVGAFNRLYYRANHRRRGRRQHYTQFLFPLDTIGQWNRLYGRRGFWQYQCIVPAVAMRDAIPALLHEIADDGEGSFLAVLKTCGDARSPGMLSFPMAGATLAIDFRNRGERTLALMSRLDSIVAAARGRLYAAKDGRIPKAMWQAGYPELGRFAQHVDRSCSSDFWRRVTGD